MASILSRENLSSAFRFFSNMFMLFIFSKVVTIRIDWIFISVATTVFAFWLCARSINAITRKIDTKNINDINRRVDEAVSFILLSILVYHFTILLMFISFIRSPDTKFIVYKICYITVFELIPLFISGVFIFLRWKDNLKPIFLRISNYVLIFTLISLTAWVVYVFRIIWGSELAIAFTKNYAPSIICYFCSGLVVILGLLCIISVPSQEYINIYETKKIAMEKKDDKAEKIVTEKKDESKKDL